jgi:DNA repair exonuclease SbcCD nuclease subunit
MRDYLSGYLDIIPQGEKRRVEEILKINGSPIASNVSETEFAELIREISEEHKQQTEFVQQYEHMDSNLFNKFFGNLQVDVC